jgi:hypothetical protein
MHLSLSDGIEGTHGIKGMFFYSLFFNAWFFIKKITRPRKIIRFYAVGRRNGLIAEGSDIMDLNFVFVDVPNQL